MKTKTKAFAVSTTLAAAVATLAACGGTLGGLPAGNLRVVNGISDTTSLDARIPNLPSDINNVTVNTASGFRTVPDSSFDLNVTLNTASGSRPTFTFNNVSIDRDTDTTVYLPGRISDNSFGSAAAFQVDNVNATLATGQVQIQPVHASSTGPASISLYITAPTVNSIVGLTPINLNYRQAAAPNQIAGGSYRLRITALGSPLIIFDSGTTGVNLATGERLQLALLNETDTTRASSVFVLAIPSSGTTPLAIRNSP